MFFNSDTFVYFNDTYCEGIVLIFVSHIVLIKVK